MNRKPTPLFEQPYDEHLLKKSSLYRMSRKKYLAQKGSFRAVALSADRALSSPDLLLNQIDYSPIASELAWSQTQGLVPEVLPWVTSVFHEQNHRILWTFLQQSKIFCPRDSTGARQYLNLVESLVNALDLALGDEFDARTASLLTDLRVIYFRGADFMRDLKWGSPKYLNALKVCFYATFLRLEGVHPDEIPRRVELECVNTKVPPSLIEKCIARALLIEPRFVDITNPEWQSKNTQAVIRKMSQKRAVLSVLPRDLFYIFDRWTKVFF